MMSSIGYARKNKPALRIRESGLHFERACLRVDFIENGIELPGVAALTEK